MKLLAIDTSTENCSVALLNGEAISSRTSRTVQKHAEIVIGMIDEVLEEQSVSKQSLDGLLLGVGPGSFTGVRIAASTVQGLALGLNLKVAKVSSLELLALEAADRENCDYVISAIDARMGEIYLALFKVTGKNCLMIGDEKVLKPAAARAYIKEQIPPECTIAGAGTGIDILNQTAAATFSKAALYPDVRYGLDKGRLCFESGAVVDADQALPLYVRNDVAWKKISERTGRSGQSGSQI